jgi:ATP-dependent protease HslVU (ClpYQ) peptidase subunit
MTCIVGLIDNGTVYIGGDSAGVDSSRLSLTLRADSKVFKRDPFVMGFTTSFRMGQLLAHSLQVPERKPGQDVFQFMVTTFVDAVRQTLKDGGFAEKDKDAEKGGTFLVGYEGRLFTIHNDYQVEENTAPYAACGCGEPVALGAMYATAGWTPLERVRLALEAAEANSAGVRAPFEVVVLKPAEATGRELAAAE